MVLISFSGHGIQDGAEILLVPSEASSGENPDTLKGECFSHNELFSILYSEMHMKTEVSLSISPQILLYCVQASDYCTFRR